MHTKLGFTAAVVTLAALCTASWNGVKAAANSEKILQFPCSYSVGWILDVVKDPGLETNIHGVRLKKAQGTVKIPRGKHLKFEPEGPFFEHPECLLKLPPDAFDYIDLRFISMADNEENISDRAIPYVLHLKGLKTVSLDKSDTTDAAAAKLAALPNLEGLSCSASMVTGKCFEQLKQCKSIRFLRVGCGQVDEQSLKYLSQFPKLQRLTITRAGLTKAGLEQACKCSGLLNLTISQNSEIDDSCMPMLMRLKNLTDLDISGTKISTASLEKFAYLKTLNLCPPRPLATYSAKERAQLKKLFPYSKFDMDAKIEKKMKRDVKDFLYSKH
ncbi:MAG: hypothetical protein WCT03_23500 [Candidatus Obscuribacterales bacterium]|jgi:hypothetical protein